MNAIASRASGKSSSQWVDKLGIDALREVLVLTAPLLVPRTGANAVVEENPAVMARKILELRIADRLMSNLEDVNALVKILPWMLFIGIMVDDVCGVEWEMGESEKDDVIVVLCLHLTHQRTIYQTHK